MIDPLWTSTQIAEVSGVPKRTISNWIATGVLQPDEKSVGSGSLNRFAKHEAEIAVLLQPLHLIWSIRADQLKIIAHHFREVMTLNTSGFLVDRHELQKWATEMIAGDGPALLAARGGGSENFNEQKREEKAKWIEATSMTESEACLFWSFVCYGIAKYKKNNAAWEIWYDNDGHYILYPRLYFDHSLSNGHYGSDSDPHGMWKHICTGDHSQRGVAIVIDLSPLSGG